MEPTLIIQIVGGVAYVILEYWLGKTEKTKAGSALELLLSVFKKGAPP